MAHYSKWRAVIQLCLAVLAISSWVLIVCMPTFFIFKYWYFITRLGCLLSGFFTYNILVFIEVLFFPLNKFYLLWRINRELLNFVFCIFIGVALLAYTAYLIYIWVPEKGFEDEFFNIEMVYFERPIEILLLKVGVILCMVVAVGSIGYGIWCIILYRYYIKRKGEKGSASNQENLKKFYSNVGGVKFKK